MGLTPSERHELRDLEVAFELIGGRDVEMAERIDVLRAKDEEDEAGTDQQIVLNILRSYGVHLLDEQVADGLTLQDVANTIVGELR